MNIQDYIHLLNNSKGINAKQTAILETIVAEFPFFQSARALYLKGLYNQDSFRYNYELKKTAAFTQDRSILFDFITTNDFEVFKKENYDRIQKEIENIYVREEVIVPQYELINTIQEETVNSALDELKNLVSEISPIKEVVKIEDETVNEENKNNSIKIIEKQNSIEERLEIGKPLEFDVSEKHSFSEWLQLSKLKPIERNIEVENNEKEQEILENSKINEEKFAEIEKKFELIEKFIEASPKITPVKENPATPINLAKSENKSSSIMTETLARIYLEQKKYSKAIQAYEILILKYPEKSSFFADRIKDIKLIQQNN